MRAKAGSVAVISLIIVILLCLVAMACLAFTAVAVSNVDRNDRSIFGISFYIVQSDSMSKSENNSDVDIHFNAGDIILIKKVEDTTVFKEGDVIAFLSTNSDSYGETVTHMVRSVRKNSAGRVIGYITYGTNTGATDEALVEPEYVLGEYTGKLSGVGSFFNFLRSSRGYVTFILIPLLLLIVYNGVNVILLSRRYKKERATEKKQNEELLLELKTLKEQLANQGGNVQSAANTEESSDT